MSTLYIAHILFAYLSLSLLMIRGVLSARRINWRANKLLNIAPHLVDSLLLLTGIALFLLAGYSWHSWIVAKLLFLVLYIVFAAKAFKKNRPFAIRPYLSAVVSFMMILLVATIK